MLPMKNLLVSDLRDMNIDWIQWENVMSCESESEIKCKTSSKLNLAERKAHHEKSNVHVETQQECKFADDAKG